MSRSIEATLRQILYMNLALVCLVAGPAQAYQVELIAVPEPDSLPPGVSQEMIVHGKEIFEGKGLCAKCHGADASGLLGPDLTDSEWLHAKGSYLEIMRQVLTGVPTQSSRSGIPMPPRGGSDISDADVHAVAAYVWKVSHPEFGDSLPPGIAPQTVSRGAEVFVGEGRCSTCHGETAGGQLGPDLTDAQWLHAKGSYLAIVHQILVGVSSEESTNGAMMPPRGGANLTDAEVHAVAAYVWALSHSGR